MYGVPFYECRKSVAFLALTDLRKCFLQQIHLVLVNVSLPVCISPSSSRVALLELLGSQEEMLNTTALLVELCQCGLALTIQ